MGAKLSDYRIKKTNRVCGVAVMMIVAGCSFNPEYKAPTIPVPATFPYGKTEQGPEPTSRYAQLHWQDYFLDPQLQELIDRALSNNRDLRSMVLRVNEAQAAYGIQRAELMPTVSGSATAARVRLPDEISPIAGGRAISQYIAGFSASWELDFWGRIQSLNEAALNEFLATDSSRAAAQISLITQVAETYLNLAELSERLKIAEKAIASRQRTFDMFSRRYQVGSGNKFDLVQAETLFKQAQSLATQLRLEQAAQINLMDLLLGDAKPFTPPNSALTDIFTAELKVGQPSDLLLQRPDIIAAEFRLKAANANIGAARAAFFPRISLNTAYGGISTELNGLFNSANRAWLFSPSISVPIFEGGRLKSNLELAEVRKNIAITNYEKTIQVAFREVADILAARQMLAEQVDIQVGVVDAQRERVRLAKLRYENGSSSYFEVLDAERDFLSAQQQLVVARFNLLTARAKLFSTLGGGYEANEDEIKISEDGINQK